MEFWLIQDNHLGIVPWPECFNIVVAHRRGNYEIYKDIPRLDFKKSAATRKQECKFCIKKNGGCSRSINSWLAKLKNGTLSLEEDGGAGCRNANEKLNLLLEYQKVTAENEGEWLRQNGLHSEHLTLFKQELSEIVANKSDEKDKKIKELEKRLKETEKELLLQIGLSEEVRFNWECKKMVCRFFWLV